MTLNQRMMIKKAVIVATLVSLVFVAASGSVVAQTPTTSVSVETDGPVSPGGEATVAVSAESAGSVRVEGIPSGWGVSSSQNDGSFIAPDEMGDDTENGTVLWAWEQDRQTLNVSVTFDVPEDTQEGNYTLDVGAERRDGMTDNGSAVITVQSTEEGDEDEGEDDESESGETEDGGDGDDGEGGGEGLPGFGPIVAIVALVSGGALRRRLK